MARLSEYAQLLWKFAHTAGTQKTVTLVNVTIKTFLPSSVMHTRQQLNSIPGLLDEFDVLLRSLHPHQQHTLLSTRSRDNFQQQMAHLHVIVLASDFADYIMGIIIRALQAGTNG